jgi:hypothetical protein
LALPTPFCFDVVNVDILMWLDDVFVSFQDVQYPKLVVEINSILFANFYNPFVTLNFEDIDVIKYYFGNS